MSGSSSRTNLAGWRRDALHEVGLGERARELTRHFLLLTATPHNGKETDFQLFLSLIDPDRFEGHQRTAGEQPLPTGDTADLMRRLQDQTYGFATWALRGSRPPVSVWGLSPVRVSAGQPDCHGDFRAAPDR